MALGRLKEVDSIYPFLQLLKEHDAKIRLSVAKALGEIGNKDAIKSLIAAIHDDNWDVRKEIESSLSKLDKDWMSHL